MSTLKNWAVRLPVPSSLGADGTRQFPPEALEVLEAVKNLRNEQRSYETIRRAIMPHVPAVALAGEALASAPSVSASPPSAVPANDVHAEASQADSPAAIGSPPASSPGAETPPAPAPRVVSQPQIVQVVFGTPTPVAPVPPTFSVQAQAPAAPTLTIQAQAPQGQAASDSHESPAPQLPAAPLVQASPISEAVPEAAITHPKDAPAPQAPEAVVSEAKAPETLGGPDYMLAGLMRGDGWRDNLRSADAGKESPNESAPVAAASAFSEASLEPSSGLSIEKAPPELAVVMARVLEVLGEQNALSEAYAASRQRIGELEMALRIAHEDRVRLQAELADNKRLTGTRELITKRRRPWWTRFFDLD
jgi:hypothetical protein